MGGQTNADKASSTGKNGETPDWAKLGTDAYNNQNDMLRAAPITAINQILGSGGMSGPMSQVSDALTNSTGTNATRDEAAGIFRSLSNGEANIDTSNFQSIYDKAGQPGAAEKYLTGTAEGQYLNANPYIDDIISKGASDVATQTNNMFASSGRYGSGANQSVLADSITSQGNQLRNANYQSERDRMMQAGGALEAAQNAGLSQQYGAAQGIAGAHGTNAQLQQAGATGLGSLGQQEYSNKSNDMLAGANISNQGIGNIFNALGQLSNVQANKLFDANAQGAVGSAIDQRNQQALMDQIKQLTALDMQDWSALAGLLGAGVQSAGNYGTNTQTTQTQQPFNPFQALGGIGSIFQLFSDRRLKTDIVRSGSENGFPMYEYAYRWEPTRRYRGVMAQDVVRTRPDAVFEVAGVLAVDYGRIGVPFREV
jgi:hypothetical protein